MEKVEKKMVEAAGGCNNHIQDYSVTYPYGGGFVTWTVRIRWRGSWTLATYGLGCGFGNNNENRIGFGNNSENVVGGLEYDNNNRIGFGNNNNEK